MTPQERQTTIDDCRRWYLASTITVPWIDKQKLLSFEKLMGAYRDKKKEDYEGLIGELFILTNMEREFRVREQMLRTLEERK